MPQSGLIFVVDPLIFGTALHLKEICHPLGSRPTHLSIPIPGCMLSGLPLYSVYNESREAYLFLQCY